MFKIKTFYFFFDKKKSAFTPADDLTARSGVLSAEAEISTEQYDKKGNLETQSNNNTDESNHAVIAGIASLTSTKQDETGYHSESSESIPGCRVS